MAESFSCWNGTIELWTVGMIHYNTNNYDNDNKKHLKNVGPIRHNEPPHAHSADVASGTVARRRRIDVHDIDNGNDDDDNDNAWQRGPLWPHGMGPMMIMMTIHININNKINTNKNRWNSTISANTSDSCLSH